ncbi:MAG: hypothetical protein AAB599_00025 [Patescibacteria group bacterium]
MPAKIQIDEKQFMGLFVRGFEELILPVLDDIYKKMATKNDLSRVEATVDRIERKQDNHETRFEQTEKRLSNLESEITSQ